MVVLEAVVSKLQLDTQETLQGIIMTTTTSTTTTKPCSICLKDKPLSEYHVSVAGYSRGCTLCVLKPVSGNVYVTR